MKPLKLIQPAKLNRFVDASIPLTWSYRRAMLGKVFPVLLFCAVMLVEIGLLHAWLSEKPLSEWLMALIIPPTAISLLFLGIIEAVSWGERRSNRWLKVARKSVAVSHAKHGDLGVKRLAGLLIEPVPERPDLAKLTLLRRDPKGSACWRWWSMVLNRVDQLPELTELVKSGELLPGPVPIYVAREPVPPRPRMRVVGLWASMIGFWLLVHGFPLLLVGLMPSHSREPGSAESSRFTEREREKMGNIVANHFKSIEEYRRFLVAVGGGLTALAVVAYAVGSRRLAKGRQEYLDEERRLLASAGVCPDHASSS